MVGTVSISLIKVTIHWVKQGYTQAVLATEPELGPKIDHQRNGVLSQVPEGSYCQYVFHVKPWGDVSGPCYRKEHIVQVLEDTSSPHDGSFHKMVHHLTCVHQENLASDSSKCLTLHLTPPEAPLWKVTEPPKGKDPLPSIISQGRTVGLRCIQYFSIENPSERLSPSHNFATAPHGSSRSFRQAERCGVLMMGSGGWFRCVERTDYNIFFRNSNMLSRLIHVDFKNSLCYYVVRLCSTNPTGLGSHVVTFGDLGWPENPLNVGSTAHRNDMIMTRRSCWILLAFNFFSFKFLISTL